MKDDWRWGWEKGEMGWGLEKTLLLNNAIDVTFGNRDDDGMGETGESEEEKGGVRDNWNQAMRKTKENEKKERRERREKENREKRNKEEPEVCERIWVEKNTRIEYRDVCESLRNMRYER